MQTKEPEVSQRSLYLASRAIARNSKSLALGLSNTQIQELSVLQDKVEEAQINLNVLKEETGRAITQLFKSF